MNIIDFFYWLLADRVRTPAEKYLRAAKRGKANAQLNLGICYYLGSNIDQNLPEAIRWLRLAAKQGNAEAKFYLGRAHYAGEGVKKDLEISYAWFEQAAQKGNQKAVEWRSILEQELTPEQLYEGKKLSKEAGLLI